jgi:hypothetical protein
MEMVGERYDMLARILAHHRNVSENEDSDGQGREDAGSNSSDSSESTVTGPNMDEDDVVV